MRRAFNIIIILVVYFGILYNKNLENNKVKTVKNTKIKQKKKIALDEDLY
jgi:hypothetical protein